MLASVQADGSPGDVDPELLRIRRIGKELFEVANCVLTFADAPPQAVGARHSMAALEAAFCYGMPLSDEPIVVPDARLDRALCEHRLVAGPPHIRFFASHPVYDQDRALAGTIGLIDYEPRMFRKADRRLLGDLAGLVERELQLRSMNALQISLEKKNKNLRRKSLIDPLIGTWNRGAIMRILTIEAIRCDQAGLPLSLIVADLDYFKKINDTYGHPAGDAVLVKVARRLRACIRPQEALGRYGGEEFLVVLPGASSGTALAVAERMRQAVAAQSEVIGGTALQLTISAGVASTDRFPAATTEELINRADAALYAAKDAGRNRVEQAVPDPDLS